MEVHKRGEAHGRDTTDNRRTLCTLWRGWGGGLADTSCIDHLEYLRVLDLHVLLFLTLFQFHLSEERMATIEGYDL